MSEQTIQSIEQLRSGEAYRMVKNIASKSDKTIKEKYQSRAKNFPSMVRTNGLLQALSFLMAKSEDDKGCELIAENIKSWIGTAGKNGFIPKPVNENASTNLSNTIDWLTKMEVESYMVVTSEVLNFSAWLKRFAEAMKWIAQDSESKEEKKDGQ